MIKPRRTWVVSAAAAAGVIGGGIATAAATGGPDSSAPSALASTGITDPVADATSRLRTRVDQLLAEEQRLHHSAALARRHLRAQIAASRKATSEPTTLIRSQPTQDRPQPEPAASPATPAPVATHVSSGASGATSSRQHGDDGEGEREGSDDD
jgi:hypothetical protein